MNAFAYADSLQKKLIFILSEHHAGQDVGWLTDPLLETIEDLQMDSKDNHYNPILLKHIRNLKNAAALLCSDRRQCLDLDYFALGIINDYLDFRAWMKYK